MSIATKKIEVEYWKGYFKSTTIEIEVPIDLKEDEYNDYLLKNKSNELSDELSNAPLTADMDGIQIEIIQDI